MNNEKFIDNGYFMLVESDEFSPPISVVNYQYYSDIKEVQEIIEENQESTPQLFSGDDDIQESNNIRSEEETTLDTDLSNIDFDDKDDLEIPAFLRRQTN